MNVIVDTDVWSEALRKKKVAPSVYVNELAALISEGRIQMLGSIRMEILCGIREKHTFTKLKNSLAAFPDLTQDTATYVLAAQFFNFCRSKGIQGSNTDFLICASAVQYDLAILTKDRDFAHYSKHLPIKLLTPRE